MNKTCGGSLALIVISSSKMRPDTGHGMGHGGDLSLAGIIRGRLR